MSPVTWRTSPISELAQAFKSRALSPREVVEAYLERISAQDGLIHSFVTVAAETALAQARQAEREIMAGHYRGPLHGIPIALKDLFDTAGIRTSANSPLFRDRVPMTDATVVRRLQAAGAVLLGKLTLYEFAMGIPYPEDEMPAARNPWHLDHIPGGSSSGSGAALAAGLCAGSLGSDTGGSIRHPAALSGVVGLKPTYGLVSRQGVIPLSWSLDHVGPMARTVADTALLLQAVAGYDPGDAASVAVNVPDYHSALTGSVTGLRIGVPESVIESTPDLQPAVLARFGEAVDTLRSLGADIRPITLEGIEHADAIYTPILLSEALAYHRNELQTRAADYGRGFIKRLLPGIVLTGDDYVQAQRGRTMLRRLFAQVMKEVDLIAMPTVRETAPTFESHVRAENPPRGPFNGFFNLTGQPAISVPCGFDHEGLPVGLMLAGRAFEETTVLRAAHAYECATGWHRRFPDDVTTGHSLEI